MSDLPPDDPARGSASGRTARPTGDAGTTRPALRACHWIRRANRSGASAPTRLRTPPIICC